MISARKRIAFWFVGLSALVYIFPTILGAYLFFLSLTGALDLELRTLASSLGHAVSVDGDKPHFRDWTRIVQTDPSRSLSTIQLYDPSGKLLEHYGADGIAKLMIARREVEENGRRMRITVTPLALRDKTVGYLQIEVPTKQRDEAMVTFLWTMAVMAPIVLVGLGACAFYVSDKATISIQQTLDMLRQFMADAGHELNTPLSIINASTEALQHKLSKQGIEMKETAVISNSADRMQRIIDDLSLLAEIETPERITDFASTDLQEIIEQALADFAVKFERREITLESDAIPNCLVRGDKEALAMMVSNLLENALRYTESGGRVRVTIVKEAANVSVTISDTGIGIPIDSLPHIFERFYRVDRSRSRSSGGSGLGLAIAKAIAQAHMGDICVESDLGKGSNFTFTLPLSA